ncbi:hypothetical protein EON65_50435 [archaeon]|nr:MAG: hypothetical protein EON65_50435 [archaeon]
MPTFILFKNGDRLTDIMGWNENQLRSLITKFK